jgi:signal peptidase I
MSTTVPPPAATSSRDIIETLKTVGYALAVALALRILLFQPFTIPSASMEPNLFEGDYVIVSKFSYGWSRASLPVNLPFFHDRLFGRAPARGDIVVFLLPRDEHQTYIKRLIGLPGDRVRVRAGQVFVNGAPLPSNETQPGVEDMGGGDLRPVQRFIETASNGRRYLTNSYGMDAPVDNTRAYVVPPHCYFMMGDNRDNSLDSRFDPQTTQPTPTLAKGGSRACAWDPSANGDLPTTQAGVGFVPEENLIGRARMVLLSWSPGASLFKPWTWVLNLRPSRFFHGLV